MPYKVYSILTGTEFDDHWTVIPGMYMCEGRWLLSCSSLVVNTVAPITIILMLLFTCSVLVSMCIVLAIDGNCVMVR